MSENLQTIAPYIPEKERLIVQRLRDFVDNDCYTVALVAGIRKVGKTTALRQLAKSYAGAVFIDLTVAGIGVKFIMEAISDGATRLLLLDEFIQLDEFDQLAQYIHDMTAANGRIVKVVMTGSSAAHITRLRDSKLGGGRARLFRLPPIMFVEYLYLTGKIPGYLDYSNVRNEHFAEYLMLDGLTPALMIQFDKQYLYDFYTDVHKSNSAGSLTTSIVDLEPWDLQAMADMIAYKLSEPRKFQKVMSPDVGAQEFRNIQLNDSSFNESGIDLSDAFITISRDKVARPIPAEDKGRILYFLLWAGLANMEITKRYEAAKPPAPHRILGLLKDAKTDDDLAKVFREASICLTSPLFYTRLGQEIYQKANVDIQNLFNGGRLLGLMLEVYVRGILTLHSDQVIMTSIKMEYPVLGEVDIYNENEGLLCEVTIHNKENEDVHVQKYLTGIDIIRVCSSWDKNGIYNGIHHIPYARLCCMADTGDIFKLPRSKGIE